MSLSARAWIALAILAAVMGLLVFVPAWTVYYWQAWAYLSIFIGVAVLTTLDLLRRDPALLERRMTGGPTAEKRPAQRLIMLVVSALDHRFAWSAVPLGAVVAGDLLVAIGFGLILRVYRENTFTSAYRNSLVHELREPGYGMEFDERRSEPYYHGSTSVDAVGHATGTLELVYPLAFYFRLADSVLANIMRAAGRGSPDLACGASA